MKDPNRLFLDVLREVLERFAFMFMDEDQEVLGDDSGGFLHVTIAFDGTHQGVVTLTAPGSLCRAMAANVLGVEDDAAPLEAGEDVLKELANIVGGEMTVALFGDEAVFDLTVPSLYRIDRGKWRELAADQGCIRLNVDNQPLLASFTLVEGR